jgi:hypothetical protein
LASDPELLASKVKAARLLREQFFDPPQSYAETLRSALVAAEAQVPFFTRSLDDPGRPE